MFDGNYCSRRKINLSGKFQRHNVVGSNLLSKRNYGRSFHSKTTTNFSITDNTFCQTFSTLYDTPDERTKLIEYAHQKREERVKKIHLFYSVNTILKLYQGWICRRNVSFNLQKRSRDMMLRKGNEIYLLKSIIAFRFSPHLIFHFCNGSTSNNNQEEAIWNALVELEIYLTKHDKSHTTTHLLCIKKYIINQNTIYVNASLVIQALRLLSLSSSRFFLQSNINRCSGLSNTEDVFKIYNLVIRLIYSHQKQQRTVNNVTSFILQSTIHQWTYVPHVRNNIRQQMILYESITVSMSYLLCFQNWLWASTERVNSYDMSDDFFQKRQNFAQSMVKALLLRLPCIFFYCNERNGQESKLIMSILASSVLCSDINWIKNISSQTPIFFFNYYEWKLQMKVLLSAVIITGSIITSKGQNNENHNNKLLSKNLSFNSTNDEYNKEWIYVLLNSLIPILEYLHIHRENMNGILKLGKNGPTKTKLNVVSSIVNEMLLDRENILITNVVQVGLYLKFNTSKEYGMRKNSNSNFITRSSAALIITKLMQLLLCTTSNVLKCSNYDNSTVIKVLAGLVGCEERVESFPFLSSDNQKDLLKCLTLTRTNSSTKKIIMRTRLYSHNMKHLSIKKRRNDCSKRHEFQTVSKMYCYYWKDITRMQSNVLTSLSLRYTHEKAGQETDMMVAIAKEIGSGTLLFALGRHIFDRNKSNDSSKSINVHADNLYVLEREAYCSLVFECLHQCTRFASHNFVYSPLLLKLSSYMEFIEGIWIEMCNELKQNDNYSNYAATTSFCDIFGHRLLSMNDEEFIHSFINDENNINQFNSDSISKKNHSIIKAKDVVCVIGRVLYELLWKRPVVVIDVMAYSIHNFNFSEDEWNDKIKRYNRARLLFSAIRLWNTLYQRWCRLSQFMDMPFCHEENWLFPELKLYCQNDGKDALFRHVEVEEQIGRLNDADDDLISIGSESDEDNKNDDNSLITHSIYLKKDKEDELVSSFKDPKIARILACIPQALPFNWRVKLFTNLIQLDKEKYQSEMYSIHQVILDGNEFIGREQVEIRREHLYSDSIERLNQLGPKLKKKVQVTFINKLGQTEPGIDGGGVFKEFMDDLIRDAFDLDTMNYVTDKSGEDTNKEIKLNSFTYQPNRYPLFVASPTQVFTVNGSLYPISLEALSHYEFVGRVLGKALYESILVEPQFCLSFLNKLLGKHNNIDDLKQFDQEYHNHLSTLMYLNKEEIDNLGLTFELNYYCGNESSRISRVVELIPGGCAKHVTKKNVIHYIQLVAHHRLNTDTEQQTSAFLRGLHDLIPESWLHIFSANELQKLISGDDSSKGIPVEDMKLVMEYTNGYHSSQLVIIWFWEVIEEMSPAQQRKFLKFMTSCSRKPLLGFQNLVPSPCVQKVQLSTLELELANKGKANSLKLPTSNTCMNLLKLPNYPRKEILRKKLLYAIEARAGFELS